MLLPGKQIRQKIINLYRADHWYLLMALPLVALLVGFLSGSYPAFYLSSFNPLLIFKGHLYRGLGRQRLRNILVLVQFLISAMLIISTLTIQKQLGFMVDKDLGFEKENRLLVPLVGDEIKDHYELLKEEIKNLPGTVSVSASSNYPGHGLTSNGYLPEGVEDPVMIHVLDIDFDFPETYGLTIVKGRRFSREFPGDVDAYMVNEAFAEQFGWEDPIGKTVERGGTHEVIGVVKNFHFASLQYPIQPLIFTMRPYMGYDYLTVHYQTEDVQSLIRKIEAIWDQLVSAENFQYGFLSDDLRQVYEGEKKMGHLLLAISIIAIAIACMGLFGMASFTLRQRTREIGIRKVMGARSRIIVNQLLREHSLWVLLANILAWPASWFIIQKILNYYSYRIEMPIWIFLLTTLGTLLLAWLTIGYQSLKASETNPADSLRYE